MDRPGPLAYGGGPAEPASTTGEVREFPDFAAYAYEHSVARVRFAIALSIALYAAFGVLDWLVARADAPEIWLIRYAIVCPLGIVVLLLTFSRRFRSMSQPVLAAFAACVGLGIVAMVAITDPGVGYLYYAGLLLVIPWISTLLQLRFAYATAACLLIVASYEVVAIRFESTPFELLLSNNFFLLSSMVIGAVAGYAIEHGTRTAFTQRQMIDAQRRALADRNAHLDSALQRSLGELERRAEELRASRARIVIAADVERRRIERNLHDGAQQQLLALAAKLNVAMSMAGEDRSQRRLLSQLRDDAHEAVENLRDLARGIYPPLLADQGLVVAITSQVRKTPLPVDVRVEDVGRYASEVEAAVYFSILEALQNVVKYANATSAVVELSADGGCLTFQVRDDGVGFDPGTTARGIGLQSMLDRLQALGGSLDVRSAPGEGTTVRGRVRAEALVESSAGVDVESETIRAEPSAASPV